MKKHWYLPMPQRGMPVLPVQRLSRSLRSSPSLWCWHGDLECFLLESLQDIFSGLHRISKSFLKSPWGDPAVAGLDLSLKKKLLFKFPFARREEAHSDLDSGSSMSSLLLSWLTHCNLSSSDPSSGRLALLVPCCSEYFVSKPRMTPNHDFLRQSWYHKGD